SHPNLGVNHITVHSPWEIIQDCSPNNHCEDNYAPLLGLADSICMGIFHYDVDTANHLKSTQTSSPSLGELALDNIKLADLELFKGLGKLSEPFSITLNPDVKPIQVPPNRYAAPKLPIIKGALDKLIQAGQLVRVNEPTAWISNMRLFGRSLHSDLPRPAATLESFTPPRDTVVADHGHRKLKQNNAYDKHTSAPLSALPPGNYVYAN
ncbi:hypothetical protein pdam_00012225, partial [Pocillopora damicornis]